MFRQISFILLFSIFALNAAAQTQPGTKDVKSSALLMVDLPKGAMRVKSESVPKWVSDVFTSVSKTFKDTIRTGETETLVWGHENFNRIESGRVMKDVETRLQEAGWEFQSEQKNGDYRTFLLVRNEQKNRRVVLGFFAATERIFVFAASELFPVERTNLGNGTPEIRAIDPADSSGQGSGSGRKPE
jgi:hypothetical protein